ncbi:MAG: sigma factor [Acidimicrobiales bacterium]
MVRLAHLITGSNAVAEEVVQEAFIRLHEHWDRADNHAAYLRTIVINLCKTQLRRPVRVDRLDNATRGMIRNDFTTNVADTQYTSILGGSPRFENRCSRIRIARIANGIEVFSQIEQADHPTGDCAFAPQLVPFTQ